jgi:hypothetical protein
MHLRRFVLCLNLYISRIFPRHLHFPRYHEIFLLNSSTNQGPVDVEYNAPIEDIYI